VTGIILLYVNYNNATGCIHISLIFKFFFYQKVTIGQLTQNLGHLSFTNW
jgi:hypothetical protein